MFYLSCFSFVLEQMCLPLAHSRPPSSKQLDHIGEIIDEFVFCETGNSDRKNPKRKVLPNTNPIYVI